MSLRLRILLTTVVLVAAGVAVGLGIDRDDDPAPAPAAPEQVVSTPLADVDTTVLAVRRAAFCAAVPAELVVEALGTEPATTSSYDNGQRAALSGTVDDVAHEYGCTWAAGPARARAWVFTPPVTPDQARALVATTSDDRACTVLDDAPAYGSPSVALSCRTARGPQVSFRGLFGDAWLTCALTLPRDVAGTRAEHVERAGRWCSTVAEAATVSADDADVTG